jgi:excinuclease ABC subunit A
MVDRVLALRGRHPPLHPGAHRARPQGRVQARNSPNCRSKGFQRVKIDGAFYEIADAPALDKKYKHDIDVVVDRVVVRPDIAARLADSLETCAHVLAEGLAVAEFADKPLPPEETAAGGGGANKSLNDTHERVLFSEKFACPVSGFTISEIEPRLFSFNNPFGACPTCDGLGSQRAIDPALVIPEGERSAARRRRRPLGEILLALLQPDAGSARQGVRLQARRPLERTVQTRRARPSCRAPAQRRSPSHYDDGMRSYKTVKTFEGVIPNLERRWKETDSRLERARRSSATCRPPPARPAAATASSRKRWRSRSTGKHIGEVTSWRSAIAGAWFEALPAQAQCQAERDRGAHPQGNPRAPALPQRRRPRLSERCRAIPARCRAARASASGLPRRSARA